MKYQMIMSYLDRHAVACYLRKEAHFYTKLLDYFHPVGINAHAVGMSPGTFL